MRFNIMKLIECSRCGHVVDIEYVDELEDDTFIGCGLNKGDLAWCDGCASESDEDECKSVRSDSGFTRTRVRDLE
jgi:hypothetical protein